MKYIQKLTLSIVSLTLIFGLQSIRAQDIDTNRMNRDINIMKNILQEMFKTQMKGSHDNIRVHSIGEFHFGQNDIRGTYLPGYGIILNISTGRRPFILFQDDKNSFSYSFQYGDDSKGVKVTEESISNRIIEFLKDYGSTIGQLSDDDKIMVIYDSRTDRGPRIDFFRSSDDKEKAPDEQLPTISVIATKSDLQAYRAGNLNEEQFRNRLDINTTTETSQKQMDMKVMANIFKTAFEESDEKSFRVTGSVDYLKLDNFGAFFSFDARYSSNSFAVIDKIRAINVFNDAGKDSKSQRVDVRSLSDSAKAVEFSKRQGQTKEEVLKAYDQFISDLKEYLVDYGRTLRSIQSNHHIMVSVNINTRYKEIPEHLDLQVQKSTLVAIDKGSMSREQVINKIQVREY